MILNYHTKTRDVLPLLNEERLTDVLDKVTAVMLTTPVTSMTIAEFAAVTDGELPSEILKERRALRCLGKIRQLRDELKAVGDYIQRMRPKPTADEERAMQGVDFPSAIERMLLDCVKFFHLHSFEEAEKMKVAEWLLVAKEEASAAKYERNRASIAIKKGGGRQ